MEFNFKRLMGVWRELEQNNIQKFKRNEIPKVHYPRGMAENQSMARE
jgi:hypothetical protein